MTTTSMGNAHHHYPSIDALRALAVLAVIAYHLDKDLLPGGFVGVDIFFVISGFVVSVAAGRRESAPLRDFLLDFFARRIRRILPALVVCLLATALMCALWIPPSWLSDNIPRTGRYAFFGLANLVLARTENSYFSPLAEFNPFTHTWSLGVEEQFYLAFPVVFAAWLRGGRWRPVAVALFGACCVLSFVYAVQLSHGGSAQGYYLLTTRFWELAAGALLYFVWSSPGFRAVMEARGNDKIRCALAALGVAGLLWSLVFSDPAAFPGYATLVPVLASMVLIGTLKVGPEVGGIRRGIWKRMVTRVGQMSYSLYLWHWPVFVLLKWTTGLSAPWQRAAAVLLSILLAALSWRFVEKPFRAKPAIGRGAAARTVVAGVLAVCLASVVARAIERRQGAFSFSTVARSPELWYPSKGQAPSDERGCTVSSRSEELVTGWRATYRRSGCTGDATAPDIFVIGDSHALAHGPAFASYALQTGASVTVYNNGGCPFLSLQPWRESTAHCRESSAVSLADILPNLRPGSVVYLPSLRLPRFVDQWIRYPADQVQVLAAAVGGEDTMQQARGVLAAFRGKGASVVLQAPGPILKAPVFRCVDWWTASNDICAGGTLIDRGEFLALREPMLRALESLAENDDGVSVFDPAESLCPAGNVCAGLVNGKPLFFDGDHMSAYGNQVLLPSFTAAMRQALARANQGGDAPAS